MAKITRTLKYRRASVTYSIDLFNSVGDLGSSDYMAVKIDGGKAYAPLGPTGHLVASHLRVKKGGSTYAVLTTNMVDLPSGFIGMFESNCPSGWTRFSSLDDRFPRASASGGSSGGGTSHYHSFSYGSIASQTGSSAPFSIWSNELASTGDHTHNTTSLSFNSDTATGVWPPYLKVVFCKKD